MLQESTFVEDGTSLQGVRLPNCLCLLDGCKGLLSAPPRSRGLNLKLPFNAISTYGWLLILFLACSSIVICKDCLAWDVAMLDIEIFG